MPAKYNKSNKPPEAKLFDLLRPYAFLILVLVLLTILSNGLNLAVPQILAHTIDSFTNGNFIFTTVIIEFFLVALSIFIFTYLQNIVQTYASERVARDLRTQVAAKISVQ